MDPSIYYIVHVLSAFVLVGWTYAACAAPTPQTRRGTMIVTGIASLVMLVAGFGLQAKLHTGFPGWLIAKIVCWLVLSALAGFAYRKPQSTRAISFVALVVIAFALVCVYLKPF